MDTKIILVRHGETDWNSQMRFQGGLDIPLNEVGKQQAGKLADYLEGVNIDIIYSSNLSRARDTAGMVGDKKGLEVTEIEGLEEINFGLWEGLTYSQIEEKYPLDLKRWELAPQLYGPPEGESLKDLQERVMKALEVIIDASEGKDILIAAHGGVNKVLLSTLAQIPLRRAWIVTQSNTAINIVNYYGKGKISVELLNSTFHLK